MANKKKPKPTKERAYLELDGEVNIVEVKGNKIKRSPIDGKLVLEVLLAVIRDGMDRDKRRI